MESISVEQVESLLKSIKDKNYQEAASIIDELVKVKNESLVKEVQELSTSLHKSLESFGNDAVILKHTKHDLPDASERLKYVIDATEEASNKTLAAAESVLEKIEAIESKTTDKSILDTLSAVQSQMTDIMVAQSFQDLTGQVLNRIVDLVTSLEKSLNELIVKAGVDLDLITNLEVSGDKKHSDEMKGIGPNVTKASKKDAVSSQDDVDDLLGDLGI
ncbi:protein phosphatase CheZ [Hydrogenovibrio kuenenii]|uniref:protein phosphatase CheZ n=1 Tax=Hydrogenovibrio kuenenii TaxID=63658 RepID=UPI0004655C18|nr:protein phosphatase CheZ [Hydrogenovibrio kuenenii]